jgi:hypothetical protein
VRKRSTATGLFGLPSKGDDDDEVRERMGGTMKARNLRGQRGLGVTSDSWLSGEPSGPLLG